MSQGDNNSAKGRPLGQVPRETMERNQRIYADIVAKYYGDPEYRDRMDRDPTATVKSEGLDVPENAEVRLVFSTKNLLHVILPALSGSSRGPGEGRPGA